MNRYNFITGVAMFGYFHCVLSEDFSIDICGGNYDGYLYKMDSLSIEIDLHDLQSESLPFKCKCTMTRGYAYEYFFRQVVSFEQNLQLFAGCFEDTCYNKLNVPCASNDRQCDHTTVRSGTNYWIYFENDETWELDITRLRRRALDSVVATIRLVYEDDWWVYVRTTCETIRTATIPPEIPPTPSTPTTTTTSTTTPTTSTTTSPRQPFTTSTQISLGPDPDGQDGGQTGDASKQGGGSDSNTVMIIGIALGGLVILIVIAALIVLVIYSKRRKRAREPTVVRRPHAQTNNESRYISHADMELHDVHGRIGMVEQRPISTAPATANDQSPPPTYAKITRRAQPTAPPETTYENIGNEPSRSTSVTRGRAGGSENDEYFEDVSQFRRPDIPSKKPEVADKPDLLQGTQAVSGDKRMHENSLYIANESDEPGNTKYGNVWDNAVEPQLETSGLYEINEDMEVGDRNDALDPDNVQLEDNELYQSNDNEQYANVR